MQIEEDEGRPVWANLWWVGPGEGPGALEKLRVGKGGGMGLTMPTGTHFKFGLEANCCQEGRKENLFWFKRALKPPSHYPVFRILLLREKMQASGFRIVL